MGDFLKPKWIPQPAPELTVWHYTNFEAYKKMMEHEELRFSNIKYFKRRNKGYDTGEATFSTHFSEKLFIENTRVNENRVFFCSWSLNQKEEGSMWTNFAKGSDGVALRTTVQKLQGIFKDGVSKASVDTSGMCGKTTYPDENIADITNLVEDVKGGLDIFFLIRNPNLQYESEFRLLLFLNPTFHSECYFDLPMNNMRKSHQEVYYRSSSPEMQKRLSDFHSQNAIKAKILPSSVTPL